MYCWDGGHRILGLFQPFLLMTLLSSMYVLFFLVKMAVLFALFVGLELYIWQRQRPSLKWKLKVFVKSANNKAHLMDFGTFCPCTVGTGGTGFGLFHLFFWWHVVFLRIFCFLLVKITVLFALFLGLELFIWQRQHPSLIENLNVILSQKPQNSFSDMPQISNVFCFGCFYLKKPSRGRTWHIKCY